MPLSPAPIQEPLDSKGGLATQPWVRWFLNATSAINSGGSGGATGPAGGDLSGTYPNPSIGPGVVTNANVSASAAITLTKLSATTASRALVSDGSGFITPATTTATEIGYVNGVTSAIQTQLNSKASGTASALTKTDDTNVTLTLGGTPATALLQATSLTLGWTGTLAASRGGTGLSSLGTGVATWLGTPSSANLRAALTDENGNGAAIFDGNTSQTLTTPVFAGNPTGTITSGTYTPTLNNTTNVAASTAFQCQYMRVGNVVTVSGLVQIDPTATGAVTLGMSLPIASNFSTSSNAGGAFADGTGQNGLVFADSTNDRASFFFTATSAAAANHGFSFTYLII